MFSKRTAEIDTVMTDKVAEFYRRQGCDPTRQELAAMQRQAAADSRARKTGRTAGEMRALWRVEAATVGVTGDGRPLGRGPSTGGLRPPTRAQRHLSREDSRWTEHPAGPLQSAWHSLRSGYTAHPAVWDASDRVSVERYGAPGKGR